MRISMSLSHVISAIALVIAAAGCMCPPQSGPTSGTASPPVTSNNQPPPSSPGSSTEQPTTPPSEQSPTSNPDSSEPEAERSPELPGQGVPCAPSGACASGLTCVKYYGIAGPRGPLFTSCEIPCGGNPRACPAGQRCVTIADGPGQVCRPTPQ